jgi:hypothetical protein
VSRRAGIAAAILLAWIAGLALLARRELFRPQTELLAEAGLRVTPGGEYYAVRQNGRQVGFASTTIDTTVLGVQVEDYFVIDLFADSRIHRASGRLRAELTRRLHLDRFTLELGASLGPYRARGQVVGDTLLRLIVSTDGVAADTQLVRLASPVLLPTAVPLALVLGERPRVGDRHQFAIFDPLSMSASDVAVRVLAESVFVVADSARPDSSSGTWVSALDDTVRAWRIEQEGNGPISGWVDEQGRMIDSRQLANLTLHRTAFEIAYQNWMGDPRRRARLGREDDIQETTAIAASAPIHDRDSMAGLRVRLSRVEPGRWELDGGRQRLLGDTLLIAREDEARLTASYRLPMNDARFTAELSPETLVQSSAPDMRLLAARIAAGQRDPRVVAERLTRWVHDSVRKHITMTIPNAMQVLRTRRGDCNEHTQLYVALARALGLPSRAAAGLAYVGGKFYYHAWPEVWLGDWVAVDPTFGQFPADAAHLRFVIGGYARQADLLRLIGTLDIDVLSTR